MKKNDKFSMLNYQNGEVTECEVLSVCKEEKIEKEYILFTDHTVDRWGMPIIYSSCYSPDDPYKLSLPETDREEKIFETMLKELTFDREETEEEKEIKEFLDSLQGLDEDIPY